MNAGSPGNVLMLTALELEYQAVREHLTGLHTRLHREGTLFETGQLLDGQGEITIAVTGEGNPGAAALTERSIAMFRPMAVIFVGVAGALKDDVKLGDVVAATKVYALHGGKAEGSDCLARPHAWDAPHELMQLAHHVARTGSWTRCVKPSPPSPLPAVHFKPVVAGEILLNSRDSPLVGHLHRFFNDAVAVEMESAGVAQAGHLNGSVPVLTIRGISDQADGAKHTADKAGWQLRAAAHAAAFALALAAELSARGPAESGASVPGSQLTQDNTADGHGMVVAAQGGSVYAGSAPSPPKGTHMALEEELAALASAGAAALVAAMATDTWQGMRDAVAALFKRAFPKRQAIDDRLDENASLVSAAGNADKARAAVQGVWEIEFAQLLAAEPGCAPELSALTRRFGTATVGGRDAARLEQTNTARGSGIVFAAQQGDVHLHPEAGGRGPRQ